MEGGTGRDRGVRPAAGGKPLACLIEERGDVAVIRASMPGAVGKIARFARKRRGARYDHVERYARCKRREEVRAHGRDAVPEAVCARVLGRRQYRVRVYVNGRYVRGAGPGRRESEN